jgi:hypothetical protein
MAALVPDRLAWGRTEPDWGAPDDWAVRDKRQCMRRSLRCGVRMIRLHADGATGGVIPADCVNISDGGLYANLAPGHAAAIGQRYEFYLHVGERGPEGTQQIVVQSGVIVRTELLLECRGDRIGVGVRLCGHRTGVIPMPARV